MCQSWLINPYPWFGRWGANLIENVRIFKFGTTIPYFLVDFRLSYQCLDSLCEKVLCLRKLGMKHRTCEAQAVSQILSFSRVQVTDGDLWGDSSRLEECRHVNSFFQIAWEGWLSGLSRGTFYFFFSHQHWSRYSESGFINLPSWRTFNPCFPLSWRKQQTIGSVAQMGSHTPLAVMDRSFSRPEGQGVHGTMGWWSVHPWVLVLTGKMFYEFLSKHWFNRTQDV